MSIAPASPITAAATSGLGVDLDFPPSETTWDSLKRFTVNEYHAMIEAGVFAEDENFELLEGLIVRKMTKHPPHWIALELLREAIQALGISGFFIHLQNPVTTSDSEPEPDLALIRGVPRDYLGGNPGFKQSPFVVEVGESSLDKDRRWKKRIYARAGIPVFWIVNLIDRQIEVFTQPTGPSKRPDYADCQIIPADGQVAVVLDGREVGRLAVKDILP